MAVSKKTLSVSAKKQAKAKAVKIEKKTLPKAKAKAVKKATSKALVTTKKKVLAKKAPTKKVLVAKKAKTLKKATSNALVTTTKKALAKKTPVKKVLAAKTKSTSVNTKAVTKRPVVSHTVIHGKNLHLIPEHNAVTLPITPLEARKKETIFQNKEEVAFHEESQKVRDAKPSKKTKFR